MIYKEPVETTEETKVPEETNPSEEGVNYSKYFLIKYEKIDLSYRTRTGKYPSCLSCGQFITDYIIDIDFAFRDWKKDFCLCEECARTLSTEILEAMKNRPEEKDDREWEPVPPEDVPPIDEPLVPEPVEEDPLEPLPEEKVTEEPLP